MYNYLILDAPEKKLYKDFMSYHKNSETDDYYVVLTIIMLSLLMIRN
jgi:hypothetical protein